MHYLTLNQTIKLSWIIVDNLVTSSQQFGIILKTTEITLKYKEMVVFFNKF